MSKEQTKKQMGEAEDVTTISANDWQTVIFNHGSYSIAK